MLSPPYEAILIAFAAAAFVFAAAAIRRCILLLPLRAIYATRHISAALFRCFFFMPPCR